MSDTILDYMTRHCALPSCEREFTPKKLAQRYCNKTCANRARCLEAHEAAKASWPRCAWARCGKQFQPSGPDQRCCSRPCAMKHRSMKQANAYVEPLTRAMSPDIHGLPSPACETCGGPVRFGSNAMTGTSTVWCRKCGEKPLQRYGAVHYDQRPDLELEIAASVERAHTLVRNPKRPEHLGDGFRQVGHKRGSKGLVEHLGAA